MDHIILCAFIGGDILYIVSIELTFNYRNLNWSVVLDLAFSFKIKDLNPPIGMKKYPVCSFYRMENDKKHHKITTP